MIYTGTCSLIGHIHLAKQQLAFQPRNSFTPHKLQKPPQEVFIKIQLGYINVPLLLQYVRQWVYKQVQVGFLVNALNKTLT
jgi:hypothetical protein